jgi:WD40 repeat protein
MILHFGHYVDGRLSPSRDITDPRWLDIETAIRRLDQFKFPYVWLLLHGKTLEDCIDDGHLNVIGGNGIYSIDGATSKEGRHRLFDSNHSRTRQVDVWLSDQGFTTQEAFVCFELSTVLRVAKHFYDHHSFDPSVEWQDDDARFSPKRLAHWIGVSCADFNPSGTRILTVAGTARLWDAGSGQMLREYHGHSEQVLSATFSPDGTQIVTASADRTAQVWDATTGQPLHSIRGHGGWVSTAQFSPDCCQIVTASDDGTSRLWDAGTGQLLRELAGHRGRVLTAEFSPDGKRIVSASTDCTARVWDVNSGEMLGVLTGHAGRVLSAQFALDGFRILCIKRPHCSHLGRD